MWFNLIECDFTHVWGDFRRHNGKPATLATNSQVACRNDNPSIQMAQGADKVSINGQPALRVGDKTNCDAQVMKDSPNVFIGGGTVTTLPIKPEMPEWLYNKLSDLTLLFAGLGGTTGKLGQVACRFGKLMTATTAAGIIVRPVDIVSGQKFVSGDDELDFVLPSRLPVAWQRYWRSGNPIFNVCLLIQQYHTLIVSVQRGPY